MALAKLNMTTDQLNETLVTALQAMKLLIENPRIVLPNGDVVLKIGRRETTDDGFDYRVADAKNILETVPELATLLELRVLEMAKNSAEKRLNELRG